MSRSFMGWDCDILQSGDLEILVTTSIGPRIISLTHKSSENLLHVIESDTNQPSDSTYRHFGGHRLWTTPEDINHTYHAENFPVIKNNENWYMSQPDVRGLQRSFKIQPIDQGFKITHCLTNTSQVPVESSPWAITMLKPGGFGFFPDEPSRSHGSTSFLPVRSLSLWSYTKMNDPRLKFESGLTKVFHGAGNGSFKIGAYVSLGWGGYYVDGLAFLKSFKGDADSYPDLGANFEIYTDENLLETETTGTVRNLKPGDSVVCSEIWQVFEADIENLVQICEAKDRDVRNLI